MAYGPPPQQGMNGCLKAFLIVLALTVVLGVVAVIVAATLVDDAVDDFADDFAEGDADEQDDIDSVECGEDDFGNLQATVTVTNDSSERSNYIIQVNFEDGDGTQIASNTVLLDNVEPGQSASAEASTSIEPPDEVECRVVEVERFSDLN
jgi:hypothetical protein